MRRCCLFSRVTRASARPAPCASGRPSEPPTDVFIDLRERLAPYGRKTDDELAFEAAFEADLAAARERARGFEHEHDAAPRAATTLTAVAKRPPNEPYRPRHIARG